MSGKRAEEILCDEIEINTPGVLIRVVGDLKELIHQGLLKQVDGNISIDLIPDSSPFPQDVVSMFFESFPGGTKYFLICETYHGQGGFFRKGTPEEWKNKWVERRVAK